MKRKYAWRSYKLWERFPRISRLILRQPQGVLSEKRVLLHLLVAQVPCVLVCVRRDCLSVHQAVHEYACFAMRRPSLLTERVPFDFGRMGLWKVIMDEAVPMNQVRIPRERDAISKTCAIFSNALDRGSNFTMSCSVERRFRSDFKRHE